MKKIVVLSIGIMFLIVGCSQAIAEPPKQINTQIPTQTIIPSQIQPQIPLPTTQTASPTPSQIPTQTNAPTGTNTPPMGTLTPTETEVQQVIETGTLEFESQGELLERTYLVFIPNSYTTTEKFPLVIYLHSYGWNAKQGMAYTQLNKVGNENNFIIVYPNASRNWNSGLGDSPKWNTQDFDDVEYINKLIDSLLEQYSIDPNRIYATGYSNGGFMAYKLACQLSHRIAAIATVGGLISTSVEANCYPTHPTPILHIHGTEDTYVPIEGYSGWLTVDETISYWTNFNGCALSETTYLPDTNPTDHSHVEKISYSNCNDNSNVIYYKIINGGHTWPGAGPPGYAAGNTNLDFSASEVIWEFFNNFSLTFEN